MRLLISGYYGFGNIGDEAILAAILDQVRTSASSLSKGEGAGGEAARNTAAEIVVLSGNPQHTRAQYGVCAVPRWSLTTMWRQLRAADLLISGGGGLIQDTTSALSPLYYLGVLALARRAGTPYMIFAQGLGPLRRRLLRRLTASAFRATAAITLRDELSAQFLADELGVARPPAQVTADPALLLSPCPTQRTEQLLRNCGLSAEAPVVGLSLRVWPQGGLVEAVLPLIRHLHEELQTQVLLIPFQPSEDATVARQLAADSGGCAAMLDGVTDPREFLGVTSSLDLLISMRLHGLIFAATAAVPALGIAYDPKVAQFARTAHQPTINLDELSTERLIQAVDDLWATRHQYATERQQAAAELREAAARNFDILAELVDSISTSA